MRALEIIRAGRGAGANLRGADLRGCLLAGYNLRRANLSTADLTGADLTGADLRGANLREAKLTGSRLEGCHMAGADLAFCDLTPYRVLQFGPFGNRGLAFTFKATAAGWHEIMAGCYRGELEGYILEIRGRYAEGSIYRADFDALIPFLRTLAENYAK